jgi:hypothetical protein
MSQFILNDTTINVINAAEAQIAGLKADNKANNQAANDQKIGAYCELIASLAPVKLVKGNLPRAVSKALRVALLEEAGLKEATAKRYVENSVGAIRMFELSGMDNATPEMVREFLDDAGIDSENKLAKAIKGEAEKSQAQMLAEQVVGKWSSAKDDNGKVVQGNVFKDGLSDEDLEEFQIAMRELMAARQAYRNSAAAKAAQADATDDGVAAYVAEGLGEYSGGLRPPLQPRRKDMKNKLIKIKALHNFLQTQVSITLRKDETHWPSGVLIEQGHAHDWLEDAILLESEAHAKAVVAAIRECAAKLGWDVV